MSREPKKSTLGRKSAVKVSPEQRAAIEAEKHAPVPLASGASYDAGRLFSGLDKAVDRDSGNRDAEVGKALKDAIDGDAAMTSSAAQNQLPGHQTVRAEVQLAPGTIVGTGKDKEQVGGVVVSELRQVYAGGDEGAVAPADAGQAVSGGKSEVLSTEVVAEAPAAPAPSPTSSSPSAPSQPESPIDAAVGALTEAAGTPITGGDAGAASPPAPVAQPGGGQ